MNSPARIKALSIIKATLADPSALKKVCYDGEQYTFFPGLNGNAFWGAERAGIASAKAALLGKGGMWLRGAALKG